MKTLKLNIVFVFIVFFEFFIMATPLTNNAATFNYLKSFQKNDLYDYSKLTTLTPATEWILCYESDQIYIYERWIPITTDRDIRERKGEMYVNCSLEEAVKMINDYHNAKNWSQNVTECKLINKNSSSNWITYTLFDLPWPLANRDVVSEYNIQTINPGHHIEIKVKSVDNLIVLKEGITRITKYNGQWSVKRITNQKCWICFTASCDNPPVISRKIQDPIVRKSFYKNLLGLKNALE